MTTTSRGNKSALIREYLLAHYPCQAIPHGDMTAIANLFGVSRELVRAVANRIGITGRISITPQARDPALCRECEAPHVPGRYFCLDHWLIPMACSGCGETRMLTRIQLQARLSNIRQGQSSGDRWFCTRTCAGQSVGASPRKKRKAMTQCRYGHEMTPENTKVTAKSTMCRTCYLRRGREYYARKTGKAVVNG